MQYMLIFREPSEDEHPRNDPEKAQAYYGAWKAYIGALNKAGVIVGGRGLQPPQTATTVRVRDGQRQVQDGPYPDTKEQLGGYYVLEVDDLDVALDWAARSPAASQGSVEIRPILIVPETAEFA